LVRQRIGVINQIRAFLLERGVAVRQGFRFLGADLPSILAKRTDVLSPRMSHILEDLAGDSRPLDERIERLSREIEGLARQDQGLHHNVLAITLANKLARSLGQFSTKGARSNVRRPMRWRPLLNPHLPSGRDQETTSGHKQRNSYIRTKCIAAKFRCSIT
jgi:hypothetical protein